MRRRRRGHGNRNCEFSLASYDSRIPHQIHAGLCQDKMRPFTEGNSACC
jgi:hypothetical protein